jgi:molybdopterin molybdotransferase
MPEFLELLPPAQALSLFNSHLSAIQPEPEWVDTLQALGRVTARPVISPEPLPAFGRSTVDGYAVRASDTFGASESLPAYLVLVGEVPMGGRPTFSLTVGQCALIHTGGMLPEVSDAVVMQENTQLSRPGEIEILRAVASAENILKPGEDVAQGQEIIPAGVRLRPAEIGGLYALGLMQIAVNPIPQIGIISSGDEVISPFIPPSPGQVRDINSYSLSALVQQVGGAPRRYGIVPDRPEALREILSKALDECDAVVITAGSSASTRDLTADVIQSMGAPGVLVHGVNVRPGKPTILGVCNGKGIIGLPGNPVSALVIAGLFVTPLVERLMGLPANRLRKSVLARLIINIPSQAGREDWIPVRLLPSEQGFLADPIFFKSNLIFSLARADGLAYIPAAATGIGVGELVEVVFL